MERRLNEVEWSPSSSANNHVAHHQDLPASEDKDRIIRNLESEVEAQVRTADYSSSKSMIYHRKGKANLVGNSVTTILYLVEPWVEIHCEACWSGPISICSF